VLIKISFGYKKKKFQMVEISTLEYCVWVLKAANRIIELK
jgi:hypothetical protein